jgi:glycosyltransferase involved in cell wall biosynthesis
MEGKYSSSDKEFCVVVPAYMEQRKISDVVRRMRKYTPHVIVVDDGSTDRTSEEASEAGAVVLRHERNMGKGAALNSGFAYARFNDFKCLITMDADGQHDPADIPRFIEAHRRTGIPVLVGNRMAAPEKMPVLRRWTNRLMSWYLSRKMKQYVPDTQCGFRLYRCDVIPFVATEAERYAAESEILLHVAARGIRIDSVPIDAIYGDEKSKINPFMDTLRFLRMIHRQAGGKGRSRRRA